MIHSENASYKSNDNLSPTPWIAALVFEMIIFTFVIIQAVLLL